MKIYVATFHGDIEHFPPIAGHTLDEVLQRIQDIYGFGLKGIEIYNHNEELIEQEFVKTPDPEDDKIEVWEYDPDGFAYKDNNVIYGKIVWGFWGWHWTTPDNMEQGKMPGSDKSLYDLAMGDY